MPQRMSETQTLRHCRSQSQRLWQQSASECRKRRLYYRRRSLTWQARQRANAACEAIGSAFETVPRKRRLRCPHICRIHTISPAQSLGAAPIINMHILTQTITQHSSICRTSWQIWYFTSLRKTATKKQIRAYLQKVREWKNDGCTSDAACTQRTMQPTWKEIVMKRIWK